MIEEGLKRKIFKLAAMKDLVAQSPFLQGKYDKLAINAAEKFGYHWNEVIQNVLFNKYVQTSPKLKEKYMKIKNDMKNKTLEEMSTTGGGSMGDGALTGNNSGAYYGPSAFAKTNKDRRFFGKKEVIKGLTPDNNINIMKNESAITNPNLIDDMYEELMSSFNVLDGIGKENNDDEENFEDDINDELTPKEIKALFIMNCTPSFNKEDLSDMNEDEINNIYDSVYKETFPQTTTTTTDVDKITQKSETIEKMKQNQTASLNEEVKSNGMVQVDRIKKENEANTKEYYKTLNGGVQKTIDKGLEPFERNEPCFEYDYNKDSAEPVKYKYADERNKEYLEMVHRGMEDLKLDIPDKDYDERLKKSIGDKAMALVKKKQEIIQKNDYKNLPKGKMEVVPETVKESYIQGYTLDKYGNKIIKSVGLSKINESTNNILSEDLIPFETKGLGNAYEPMLKEQIEKYDFYYSKNEDKYYKTNKKPDTSNKRLDEGFLSKFSKLTNYQPSKFTKNLIDKSKF